MKNFLVPRATMPILACMQKPTVTFLVRQFQLFYLAPLTKPFWVTLMKVEKYVCQMP